MRKESRKPIETLICYSICDEDYQVRLKTCLEDEKRLGRIISIAVDKEDDQVEAELKDINPFLKVALIVVSQTFLEQKFASSEQMNILIEKHKRRKLHLIPVVVHPVNWRNSPLSELQALPRENRPITKWPIERNAWLDIIQSIRLICNDLQYPVSISRSFTQPFLFDESMEEALTSYDEPTEPPIDKKLHEVFVTIGIPHTTFVEPEEFWFLKVVISQPGRGVIIEGPSGVGKTTAWEKALEMLPPERIIQPITRCDAKIEQVRVKLNKLMEWHKGTVIIDDFHKLGPGLRKKISDYMKSLADKRSDTKKLVLVGIPNTGQALVDNARDLIGRVDVFPLGRVNDDLINFMIEAGETALNIKFDRKADIMNVANGSLSIAQTLCFYICSKEDVFETQKQLKIVTCNIDEAVSYMMKQLSYKYETPIQRFAALDGPKSTICLELLEALSFSENGMLRLNSLKEAKRHYKRNIDIFLKKEWIYRFFADYPEGKEFFFFNKESNTLIVDDPRMTFYLQRTHFSDLAAVVGKLSNPKKVFICYSHKDVKWLNRLKTHLTPLQLQDDIEIWDDTRIKPGANWKEEIQRAIESAKVAVILVSPDLLASEFIRGYTLPAILSRAENEGTRIFQLVITHCTLDGSGLKKYTKMNPRSQGRDDIQTLTQMNKGRQDDTFVDLVEAIKEELASYRNFY